MDDRDYFGLEGEALTGQQTVFLAALRHRLGERLRPYVAEVQPDSLFVVLDVDAPDIALVSVGLLLCGDELRGDRISVHDRNFPPTPTGDGFLVEGPPLTLADRGTALFEGFANRPMIKHEWLHGGRVYADCYLFEDSGEPLAQMYRGDWAPRGQEAQLIADGFVHGNGWIQTSGLGVLIGDVGQSAGRGFASDG